MIESIQGERPLLAEHLKVARPSALGDGELTLAWAETSGLSRRKAEDPPNRELIGRAIRAVTGASLRLAHEMRRRRRPRRTAPTLSERRADRALRGRVRGRDPAGARSRDQVRGDPLMPPQPNMQQMMKQVQKMQADMMAAQESLKDERVEASAGGGMVKVVATGELAIESITIDPAAVDPEDVEMLQDTVLAAVNQALTVRAGARRHQDGQRDRRARRPGRRPRRAGPARYVDRCSLPRPAPRHRAGQAPRHRQPHGAAPGLPRAAHEQGGRVRAGRGDPRREGQDHAVRGLLQPRRGAALHDLRRTSGATRR